MSNFRRPFTDAKQQKYVQCAVDLDVWLSLNHTEYDYYDKTVGPTIISLCSDSDAGVLRYCQAMITEMGRVKREKMDVIASFIVWYYEKIVIESRRNQSIKIPPIEDIASLINLYLNQICPSDFDHRIANICLLMVKMGDWYSEEKLEILFSEQAMAFFISCLYKNPDKWTQLYILFNLMHSSNYELIKRLIFNNYSLRLAVKQISAPFRSFKPISLYRRTGKGHFLHFQIGSIAEWLMRKVYDADKIIDDDDLPLQQKDDDQAWDDDDTVVVDYPEESETASKDKKSESDEQSKSDENNEQSKSDKNDEQSSEEDNQLGIRTSQNMKHLSKVTACNLSVIGCHFAWQDYQFSKSVDITSGKVFYYEVILLTTGSIRVGWATKLNDSGFYGFSSHINSISFDPYEKRIRAEKASQSFSNLPPVNACDVVGCFLDTTLAGTVYFKFYLNGKEVGPHCWDGERLSLSHCVGLYPTVSLSGCQQVYFNFGQLPYRYSPLLPVHQFSNLIELPPPVIDVSSRMFVDEVQKKYEQWMLHFDWSIAEDASVDDLNELGTRLLRVSLFQSNSKLRIMQAMIDGVGLIDENRIEVSARWMEIFFKKVLSDSHTFQPVQLILKLLQPYLNLQDTCMDTEKEDVPESVISKSYAYSRNICLLLSILPSLLNGKDKAISEIDALVECTLPFLVSLVMKNKHDAAAKLYALRALKSLAKSPRLLEELSTNTALLKHIELISKRSDDTNMEGETGEIKCSLSEKESQMVELSKLLLNQLNIGNTESVQGLSSVV